MDTSGQKMEASRSTSFWTGGDDWKGIGSGRRKVRDNEKDGTGKGKIRDLGEGIYDKGLNKRKSENMEIQVGHDNSEVCCIRMSFV